MKHLNIKQNFIDKAVGFFSPKLAAERFKARVSMAIYDNAVNGYAVPGSSKRFMRGIHTQSNSPDADTVDKLEDSVSLSRDLYMHNTLGVAILRRIKTNVVGTGLKLQSTVDYEALGISQEAAAKWQRNVEREFNAWAQSKDCDITRSQNFYELQDLAFFTVLLSGDACVAFPYKELKSLSSPVRIRLIEGDLLRNQFDVKSTVVAEDGKRTIAGVTLDADGAPVSYTFANFYTGSNEILLNQKWVTIPAFDNRGYRQIFHMMFRDRPGQTRGMPLLANVVNDLVKITKLKDAELTAHVVASFFTVFVKDMSGYAAPIAEGFGIDQTDPLGQVSNTAGDTKFVNMGAGNVVYLDDDKEVQIADPRQVSSEFESFYMSFVKEIAGACEVPVEQVLLQFTASYSASRGALLEAWKAVRIRRGWLAINFCQPAYEKWLEERVASNAISAPGFFESPLIRAAWCKTSWAGMGNGQLDPLKETKASVAKIINNLSSHEKEYNSIHDDGDWEANIRARRSEQDLIESLELEPKEKLNQATKVDEEQIDD